MASGEVAYTVIGLDGLRVGTLAWSRTGTTSAALASASGDAAAP
jgi:hypothetical protein